MKFLHVNPFLFSIAIILITPVFLAGTCNAPVSGNNNKCHKYGNGVNLSLQFMNVTDGYVDAWGSNVNAETDLNTISTPYYRFCRVSVECECSDFNKTYIWPSFSSNLTIQVPEIEKFNVTVNFTDQYKVHNTEMTRYIYKGNYSLLKGDQRSLSRTIYMWLDRNIAPAVIKPKV